MVRPLADASARPSPACPHAPSAAAPGERPRARCAGCREARPATPTAARRDARILTSALLSPAKQVKDLLHPSATDEKRKHKLKRLVQQPNSFFMDVKCPGCFTITCVFSHAQVCARPPPHPRPYPPARRSHLPFAPPPPTVPPSTGASFDTERAH